MSLLTFLNAYRGGEAVGVTLPHGGLYGVVGFLLRDDGVSFMDDAFLDDMPTRHADHHLNGTPLHDAGDIVVAGHRFHVLAGDDAARWRRMFGPSSVANVRSAAEGRLLELRAPRNF